MTTKEYDERLAGALARAVSAIDNLRDQSGGRQARAWNAALVAAQREVWRIRRDFEPSAPPFDVRTGESLR